MADKKKKGRRAYLNNFERNADGSYEYKGDRYRLSGEEPDEKRVFIRLLTLAGVLLVLILAEGCLPVPGLMGTVYVVIPYVIQLAGAADTCMACARLVRAEYPLREYIYESAVRKLPFRSGIVGSFAAVTFLGETIFLIRNGIGGHGKWVIAFYILQTAGFAAAIIFRRSLGGMEWVKHAVGK